MHLLNLVRADGLHPKRTSSIQETYSSPCPGCAGDDRFTIWGKTDRYWCRKCDKKGDAVQYLRDFHSLSYPDACARLGKMPQSKRIRQFFLPKPTPVFKPNQFPLPPPAWSLTASSFIKFCHQQLMSTPAAIDLLLQRGFTMETIQSFQLGWNPSTVWEKRSDWGLSDEKSKKVWLPKGIVIPTFHQGHPIKLKVRRSEWTEKDELPKYVEISGSMQIPSFYGSLPNQPIVITEAEFDSLLILQCASDLCASLALGGCTKRPDAESHEQLIKAPLILFACDVDEAGIQACRWWRQTYSNLKVWVPPIGKSPGDAYQQGIDLRRWIEDGLNQSHD